MKEIIFSGHQTEQKSHHSMLFLTERLEQLGYQCIADNCEQFTTVRLIPIETKRKEEIITPPPE
jgi:hypothetical protein